VSRPQATQAATTARSSSPPTRGRVSGLACRT
jgi:hypothetical protein